MYKSIDPLNSLPSIIFITKITYFLAIDRLSDGMGPSDNESQILWDTLIEHGRKYLGKSIYLTTKLPIDKIQ